MSETTGETIIARLRRVAGDYAENGGQNEPLCKLLDAAADELSACWSYRDDALEKRDFLLVQNTRMTVEIAELGRRLAAAEGYGERRTHQLNDVIRDNTTLTAKLAEVTKEIERLKEYEWMYKDLCK